MNEQRVNILDFLKSWLSWAEDGGITKLYSKQWGLCSNLQYLHIKYNSKLDLELKQLFEDDGLYANYPFGENNYEICSEQKIMHKDELRLAWVRKTIQKLESIQETSWPEDYEIKL